MTTAASVLGLLPESSKSLIFPHLPRISLACTPWALLAPCRSCINFQAWLKALETRATSLEAKIASLEHKVASIRTQEPPSTSELSVETLKERAHLHGVKLVFIEAI